LSNDGVNGLEFPSGGISEILEIDSRQIVSRKTAYSQSGVVGC